jgi:hypothetical protein
MRDIPTPAYHPYENRLTTRQDNSRQTHFSPTKTTTMYFSFFHRLTTLQQRDEQPSVVKHEPESMSVEGGEFLDDAIRMEDVTTESNESLGETLSDLKKKGYDADLSFETNTFALYGGDLV